MPLLTKEMYAMLGENEKVRGLVEALEDRTRLRDQFAAAAIAGMLDVDDVVPNERRLQSVCKQAFVLADAMLAAREVK